ncbi:MAG TPA: transaldolase [Phycisphaerae bacterium]|nr:transaldolase [Phycisphaerae bacterium]
MSDHVREIKRLGQAIWLDFISRELLGGGELRRMIDAGLTGMTSNPTIFQKSIATGHAYDPQIRELVHRGLKTPAIYEALAVDDVGRAADQLRGVYNDTHGRDGYVSIEVSPKLAHDTAGTVAEGRRLFGAIGRPNVMIKVPATPEGLPAITTLLSEGINVNVTLIFSIRMYEKVMEAHLAGLEKLTAARKPVGLVASVASFFVSRVDSLVDKLLAAKVEATPEARSLMGKAAIANARIAYSRFQDVYGSPRFAALRAAGARVQRPLWASTSTKNPDYPDTMYVDELIGPDTVNTVPPATWGAIIDHGRPQRTIDRGVDLALAHVQRLSELGIEMDQVTDQLLREGVKSFADSFEELLADLERKRATIEQTVGAH